MSITSPYDILFEPVQIGPVTAPNRFYQVPHCNGFGYRMPRALAAMRGIKADGGWGVVCTEDVAIHHSSDLSPAFNGRLWSDEDIPPLALMVEAVHAHGSLAGIELAYNGYEASNLFTRVPPLGPASMGTLDDFDPVQTRRMDKEDIRNLRRWHRKAALRAKQAGFDLVYVYAGHGLSAAAQFMLTRYNDRTDEYGGSLENRVRLFRELLEDTKEAVGDKCGVVARFAVEELLGEQGMTHQGEGHDIIDMLANLPDLWDVNVSNWSNDSATSRFEKEGFQEKYTAFVKTVTNKPVVGVGRYTSPDAMVSAVRRGVLDLIGAARPSIADPFLPAKIKEDRLDEIRECIGCNICVSGDTRSVPIRCTQNPTMGEEWRRGWHPEIIAPKKSEAEIMIVGAGPAGLECAVSLGQRGYNVTLLEANRELGGRVIRESALPGLSEWRRVADWRLARLAKMPNVGLYPSSLMTAPEILETGIPHVVLATGSTYQRDGKGRSRPFPIPGHDLPCIYTPEDLMNGTIPKGHVILYDDDHFYLGGVLAELLVQNDCNVTLITPAPMVSYWTQYTLEQEKIQTKLMKLGVTIFTYTSLTEIKPDIVAMNSLTGETTTLPHEAVVLVTDRMSNDHLYYDLQPALAEGKLKSLRLIGDAEAPNIIAQAVFSGHLAAREFDEELAEGTPFKIERTYP